MTPILLALLLTSNATGKTMVRQQQGTLVPIASATAAFVDVAFDGAAWRLTGYGAL
jgi:hypothetical protein